MIVVDSSVWISALRGIATPQSLQLKTMPRARHILLGDIVLLEILQGAQNDMHAANLQKRLTEFAVVPMLTPEIAIKAAGNFRRLREKGVTIRKTADLIIGTFCIEHDYSLLHADRDFDPMAEHLGLRVA
ncbi:MAG: PIN domain nuclease [Shinella sp.]|uniref:type II toxin-antitoxin system VapC family toxin n=1 Tax=Shinella sp. TaxID=1870904 RepID=UPI003C78788F